MIGFLPISDRVVMANFNPKPLNLNKMKVPTAVRYEDVGKAIKNTKKHTIILSLGEFNAKVVN